MNKRFLALLIALTVSLMSLQWSVQAQGNNTIDFGQSVTGKISNDAFRVVYSFQARKGDIIDASLTATDSGLDPVLLLADAEGNVLVSNDEDANSPGTLDAAIYDLRIKQTGNYLLVATRFGREAGDSKGGYSLSLDRLPPESLGVVPEKAILLDYGNSARGSIDANSVMRFYLIEAQKGDVLTINAEGTRGNLDPT